MPRTRDNPVNESSQEYQDGRRKILWFEEALLRTLCFDLTVRQPYPVMLDAVERIWRANEDALRLKRVAWPFITDS